MYINGHYSSPVPRTTIPSLNPCNGEPWYVLTDAREMDIGEAVGAARNALNHPSWSRITQTERGALLRRLGDLIAVHGDRLAEIETRDNGKLIREMRAQMASLPQTYYYYAGMADKLTGETIPVNKRDVFNFTLREPIGVVGIIVPWNSPLYLLSSALAPCLAVGNTVVAKPAENTSASALEFANLIAQAGFPPGVFNVITGLGETAGEALARHPGVDKIAFTGGTATGRRVAANAARNLVSCTLELGGKSPNVVFEDADPERAANGIVAGAFAAGGQTCIAGSRCFLQETIYDQVLEKLGDKAGRIIIGDPMEPDTQLGPLSLKSQLERVGGVCRHRAWRGRHTPGRGETTRQPVPGQRVLFRAHDIHRHPKRHAGCPGRNIRAGGRGHAVFRRKGPDRKSQRFHLWTGRRGLDPGH